MPAGNCAGNFFPPTLIADVPNDAEVMQEESFGPLLPVLEVASDEEALRRGLEEKAREFAAAGGEVYR